MKIGDIVLYTLSQNDADEINRRRVARPHEPGWPAGAQAHHGNTAHAGEVVPVIVTGAWSDISINGQAILDGNDSFWITSAVRGDTQGTWHPKE